MRISIVTFSCCNPAMRSEDQKYLEKVRSVLKTTNTEAQVGIVTAMEASSVLSPATAVKVRDLFEKYGLAMMPAMLIDDELVLYGGVPTVERISEVIGDHVRSSGEALPGKRTDTKVSTGARP